MENFDKVKDIIVDRLGVDADKVTEDASFKDDLGADSLDIAELVMELEDEFGTEIPDEEAEKSILLVMQLNTSIVLKNKNLHLSRLQDGSIFLKNQTKNKHMGGSNVTNPKIEMVNDFQQQFAKKNELGFTYSNIDLYQQAFLIQVLSMTLIWTVWRIMSDSVLGDAVLELTVSRYLLINIRIYQKVI